MPEVNHGTYGGYQAEMYLGTGHCEPCRAARREYMSRWRQRRGNMAVGRYTLTICAAGYDRPDLGPVVCGLPPHHRGAHHDVRWPVMWAEEVPGG